jgi:hypothetical protein
MAGQLLRRLSSMLPAIKSPTDSELMMDLYFTNLIFETTLPHESRLRTMPLPSTAARKRLRNSRGTECDVDLFHFNLVSRMAEMK